MTGPPSAYAEFLATKRREVPDVGRCVKDDEIHPSLFDFQRVVTQWAARKGRAAIFADTGLGKTRMQLEWARAMGRPCLILAPLAVTHQTAREAEALGIDVAYARDQDEVSGEIAISNYERLERFDPTHFGAVVLDESSILKAFSGKTKRALIRSFAATPYRLACTATPAPNDLEELCNHADFLGIMKPNEMRSTFFIADSRGEFMKYRLKGHARGAFFRWLSSWAMALKRPSDLGFEDDGFVLPGLDIEAHFIAADYRPEDRLFVHGLEGVSEAAAVRRGTLAERVGKVVELVEAEPGEAWLLWCGLNDEGRLLGAQIADAVVIEGSDQPEAKADALLAFADGAIRVLVTKPSIAGFGMNFQRCARTAFTGLGWSYEQYYQAIRRVYRFGQHRRVVAHVVLSDIERPIYEVVLAKERQAEELSAGLLAEVRDYERTELFAGTSAGDTYEPSAPVCVPEWI